MVPTLCLYFPRRRQFGCHEAFVEMSKERFTGRKKTLHFYPDVASTVEIKEPGGGKLQDR